MQSLSGFIKDSNIHNIDEILGDQGLFAMLLHFCLFHCSVVYSSVLGIEIVLLSSLLFSNSAAVSKANQGVWNDEKVREKKKKKIKMKEKKKIKYKCAKLLEMSSSSLKTSFQTYFSVCYLYYNEIISNSIKCSTSSICSTNNLVAVSTLH